MKIEASLQWLQFCEQKIMEAKKAAAQQVYEKYGNSVLLPMFLHVDLVDSLSSIFQFAPNTEEAIKFINQAIEQVKNKFQDKYNND